MKINHDVKVRRAGHTITVWCKTHDEVLFVHQGRGDIPLAEVLEAVAEHRGQPRTVGSVRLTRLADGTYRMLMDDVNLSAAVLGESAFVIQHTENDEKLVTITLVVDSVDFDKADVKTVRNVSANGLGEMCYESTLFRVDQPSRSAPDVVPIPSKVRRP